MRWCGAGEQHERHDRHPAEQAGLERGQRDGIRLGRRDLAILQPEAAHWRDREILEDDAERESEQVVAGVFSSQGHAGDREGQPEYRELGDHVAQGASSAAVAHLDGHRDPPWPGVLTRRCWLVSAVWPGCASHLVMSVLAAVHLHAVASRCHCCPGHRCRAHGHRRHRPGVGSPPAPVQRERERAEIQRGDREDEIHHAHRLTPLIEGNVAGDDARATETDG